MCVGSVRYPACNAHAPYHQLLPARLYSIFPQCLKWHDFRKKKIVDLKIVFWFSLQHDCEPFLIIIIPELPVPKLYGLDLCSCCILDTARNDPSEQTKSPWAPELRNATSGIRTLDCRLQFFSRCLSSWADWLTDWYSVLYCTGRSSEMHFPVCVWLCNLSERANGMAQ